MLKYIKYQKCEERVMEETRQANFRVTPEAADKFRKFCTENGFNQAQGFSHIIEVLELNIAKEKLFSRETEIEEFERHIKALMNAYVNSLELAENADARMLEKYENDLKSKDKTIRDLQDDKEKLESQIQVVRQLRSESEQKAKDATEKMENAVQQRVAAEQAAQDKENLNAMLQTRLAEADHKAKHYDELKEQMENLSGKFANMERQSERDKLEAQIALEKAVQSAVEEKESEIRSLEKENARLNSQIEQDRANTDSKVAAAKLEGEQKISALEKDHREELKRLYEQINSLREENMKLTRQLLEK